MSDADGSGGSGRFSHDSPRPPVPGGEEVYPEPEPIWRGSPQLASPRRSRHHHHHHHVRCHSPQQLGLEPESGAGDNLGSGSLGDGSSAASSGGGLSPPACLRWACNLHSLLEDSEGVDLFTKYLEQEGQAHVDTLRFLFACKGLKKQEDSHKISQLVKVIYKKYFVTHQLAIPEKLRREVSRRVKDRNSGPTQSSIFDDVQTEVEKLINETTYPNFLKSDLYLEYVQSVQFNGEVTSTSATTSSSSSSGGLGFHPHEGNGCSLLQTVHEDVELETPQQPLPRYHRSSTGAHSSSGPSCSTSHLTLTKDLLIATQNRRALECRPRTEAFAETLLSRSGAPHPAYSSYNPVSRQDSELQSLSSDARTESDNMSLTDSSLDGGNASSNRYRPRKNTCRSIRESVSLNRDAHVISLPRPPRDPKKSQSPEEFATELIEKLKSVLRDQENEDKINRFKRHAEDDSCEESRSQPAPVAPLGSSSVGDNTISPRVLVDAIRNKLHVPVDEDDDQAILDEHVSRVWKDLTPSRSPRPRSPEGRRRGPTLPSFLYRHSKKEKDVFSTFSSDSGNVRDMPEGSLPKSRSMPDYSHPVNMPGGGVVVGGNKRSHTEPLTEDSGVSVVSDSGPSIASGGHLHHRDHHHVRSWLRKSEKNEKTHQPTPPLNMMTSSCSSRHGRNKQVSGYNRSDSLERYGGVVPGALGVPAQPFVADPSMPPLPSPHTPDQLEEARRRLLEDERGKSSRGRISSGKSVPDPTSLNISGQSTMRKSGRRVPSSNVPTATSQDSTVVVFNFCDEQIPYLSKIPGRAITLKQFKEFLPKKGAYRFFFKTECEDLDIGVIQEEITDDNEVLPLWDGKIMAQVKFID